MIELDETHVVGPGGAWLYESPLWDHRRQVMLWVDVEAGDVYEHDPATDQTSRRPVADVVPCIALRAAGGYVIARRGESAAAAIFSPTPTPPMSAWITYFDTNDIHSTVARAQSLGGTAIHPVTTIASVGQTAWVNDPQGATFGLMQPESGWFERLLASDREQSK